MNEAEVVHPRGVAPELAALGGSASATVLVVEDDAHLTDLLAAVLAEAGLRVATAGDGRQALSALEVVRPDGIVLDLALPEVSGYRLMELLKRDPATAHVPVLILTALS